MKKVWFILAMMISVFASCSDGGIDNPVNPTPKPEEVKTEITIDSGIVSNGLSFGATEGEQSISISVNANWTLSVASTTSGVTWCKASATSGGKGSATVKFTVDENTGYDDRSVSVTIKAGSVSKTFTITQKGADALLVTTTKYEVAQEGGQIEIEVKTNISYQMEIAEDAKSWITEVESKGRALTTNKHKLDIAMNEDTEKREGEITFKSGDKVETVKVYQAGGAILLLSQNEYNVSDKGDTISIDIKSNIDFGVQMPDVDWIIDEASSRGLSSHTLKYIVSANEEYDSRSAEIIFYDKNSDLKDTLKVVQAQKDAIILSEKNISVAKEGGTIEVKVNTNVDFEVQIPSNVTWISQIESRSMTEHILYFEVRENDNDDRRTTDVIFTDKTSVICETLTVTQKGNSAQLISGKEFKLAIYNLANNKQETNYEVVDEKIESIKYTQIKDSLKSDKCTIVSTDDSELPIYATWDGSCIELQSKAKSIDFNVDASYMFYKLHHLNRIDINGFETSQVKNMSHMFSYCTYLQLDTLSFDTRNVEDMSYMFENIFGGALVIDLNTSNVKNMEGMFRGYNSCKLEFKNFNTSNVINMKGMFNSCGCDIDLSLFDTSRVTDMSYMFSWVYNGCIYDNKKRDLDLSNFNTSNVVNMEGMFKGVSKTSINLSSFDTRKVENMREMFREAWTSVDINLSNFNTSNVKDMKGMFDRCKMDTIDISNFDMSNVVDMSYMFSGCERLKLLNLGYQNMSKMVNMRWAFTACSNLKDLDIKNLKTENVTDMECLFALCSSLEKIDLSNFKTDNVTNMRAMFEECTLLTSLDITHFNTSKATDMQGVFSGCMSLAEIDLSNFDTSNVTNMDQMFYKCSSLIKIDLSNFDTRNVTSMWEMFSFCTKLEELYINGFDTRNNNAFYKTFGNLPNIKILDLGTMFIVNDKHASFFDNVFGDKSGVKIVCCYNTMEFLKKTLSHYNTNITWINAETNVPM